MPQRHWKPVGERLIQRDWQAHITIGRRIAHARLSAVGRVAEDVKKRFSLVLLATLAWALPPAPIDGRWHAALDGSGRGNQYGTRRKAEFILELKADGTKLKGHVVTQGPRQRFSDKVQEGRIDGPNFSFVTVAKRRRTERRFSWSGSIENNVLHGYRTPAAGAKGQPFTAVR